MILYLDTSALVKIYVEETSSTEVRDNAKEAEGLATSRIAYAEARAAFARKRREQGLSRAGYRAVVNDLDQDGTTISSLMSLTVWFGRRVFWPSIML